VATLIWGSHPWQRAGRVKLLQILRRAAHTDYFHQNSTGLFVHLAVLEVHASVPARCRCTVAVTSADAHRPGRGIDEALKLYRGSVAIRERLAAADRSNTQWQNDLQISIDKIGGIAYNFILARKFVTALETADQAISLAPEKMWLYTNRAHALMFLDRLDEAGLGNWSGPAHRTLPCPIVGKGAGFGALMPDSQSGCDALLFRATLPTTKRFAVLFPGSALGAARGELGGRKAPAHTTGASRERPSDAMLAWPWRIQQWGPGGLDGRAG
jgi:hypothetical protein